MKTLLEHFPDLTRLQSDQFEQLGDAYRFWNQQINVISRKDIDHLYTRHILHSLSIAKFIQFRPGAQILDVGTGGGFPGIPLAIMFPDAHFTLVDSIGKKIKVVNEISKLTGLKNLNAIHGRAEELKQSFDFIVSRAVASFEILIPWIKKLGITGFSHGKPNGLVVLKGGNLDIELKSILSPLEMVNLSSYFNDPFFEEKKLVFLPFPIQIKKL